MVDPGTAAFGVITAILAVSGYGVSKEGSKGQATFDEAVLRAANVAKDQLMRFQRDRDTAINKAKSLETEKVALEAEIRKLRETVNAGQQGELLFRGASVAVLKQAAKTVRENETVKAAVQSSQNPEAVQKVLDSLTSIRSLTPIVRGTMAGVFERLTKANNSNQIMDRDAFLEIYTRALERAPADIDEAARLAKEKKTAEAQARAGPPPEVPPVVPPVAPEVPPVAAPGGLPEVPPVAPEEPEAQAAPESPEYKLEYDTKCNAKLAEQNITNWRSYLRWTRIHRVDRPGATDEEKQLFGEITGCATRMYKGMGGMRKKTLRSRRGVKQNERGSRRSKNRANRSHPNTR